MLTFTYLFETEDELKNFKYNRDDFDYWNPAYRDNLRKGSIVMVKIKERGVYSREKCGRIDRLLTSKKEHTRGIKVRLDDGTVGRVTEIYKYNRDN